MEHIDGPFAPAFFLTPETAFAAHQKNPADIVVTDLRMAGATGVELISQMSAIHPDALYMLLSGDADLESALVAVNKIKAFRFLLKPIEQPILQLALNAALTELNLRQLRRIASVSHAAVDRMKTAIAYLNEKFELVFCNPIAEKLLIGLGAIARERDGTGRLQAGLASREFHSFLEGLKRSNGDEERPSLFHLAPPDNTQTIVISAKHHADAELGRAAFSLVFHDPNRSQTSPESIVSALKILPSEARVVHAIAEGRSVDEAALAAGVSINSARTYLRSVYEKTGVSRQGELVRLVLLTAS